MQEIFLCNLSVIILYTYFHYHLYSKNHLLNYPEQNFGQLNFLLYYRKYSLQFDSDLLFLPEYSPP